jgi:hypothetical protein
MRVDLEGMANSKCRSIFCEKYYIKYNPPLS